MLMPLDSALTAAARRFRRGSLQHFPPPLARGVLRIMYSAKRLLGFSRWLLPALARLSSRQDERLLMVYDFASQPLSVGDLLTFHEASLVLREQHGVEAVDFAFIYDPEKPLATQNSISPINREEFTYQLAAILPLVQFNRCVGSFFVFDSRKRFERFITSNVTSYKVWPPPALAAGGEYLLYEIFNEVLYSHFQSHGSLPNLAPRRNLVDWTTAFFRRVASQRVPITVQLRNNRRFSHERAANAHIRLAQNSNIDAWLEFFRDCEQKFDATFVVIGSSSEIDERMRGRSNVVIAKDFYTSVEQDLALIQAAAMHLGNDSGPVVMAVFNSKPYMAVNSNLFPHLHREMKVEGRFQRFFFAGPLQRYAAGRETSEFLMQEFERMWRAIDKSAWRKIVPTEANSETQVSWLR
jgi:hypothetical protein